MPISLVSQYDYSKGAAEVMISQWRIIKLDRFDVLYEFSAKSTTFSIRITIISASINGTQWDCKLSSSNLCK
jgi:hypothetical protein